MGGCGVAIYSLALGKGFSNVTVLLQQPRASPGKLLQLGSSAPACNSSDLPGDGFPSESFTVPLSLALAQLWGKKVSPKLRSRRDLLGGEDLGEWLHLPVWKKGTGLI